MVTGDKGMAGAYNHNITKMTEEFMANTPGYHKLYVLGVVGRQYFSKKNVDMDGSFRYTVQKPTMHRARMISEEVIRSFLDREVDEVHIIYTQMQNADCDGAVNMQLLPLKNDQAFRRFRFRQKSIRRKLRCFRLQRVCWIP